MGPDFASLATSSAHVDGVRFLEGARVVGGFAGGRGGELSSSMSSHVTRRDGSRLTGRSES